MTPSRRGDREQGAGKVSGPRARRGKATSRSPASADPAAQHDVRPAGFQIVGIGASAGGLDAFTKLLEALPADTGMSFVIVPHLDPTHDSALVEILSRSTALPVRAIADQQRALPDHVHVLPPDAELSIGEGVLRLHPRSRGRTVPRPIDAFFESLAQDQRERSIGVILSGTANDGTRGLETIKAEGGITFAQDASAKQDSMPRSAVAAGVVDLVLSPAEIARELARIAKHPYGRGGQLFVSAAQAHDSDGAAAAPAESADGQHVATDGQAPHAALAPQPARDAANSYTTILHLLRNHSGVDFTHYKTNTIQRRISRRMVLKHREHLQGYAEFLRGNVQELEALYSDVLISVTSFFRNPEAFEALQREVIPRLFEQPTELPIRSWVLGCSTGQEAYSLAIAFIEGAESSRRSRPIRIFATDLNDALLEKARHGLYPKSLAGDLTPERLRRFFTEEEGGYRVNKRLRDIVVFARHNLVADPPFSRMDLISCRNLLIYLEPSLQQRAIPTFHYALRPGHFLMLGASESIGAFTDLFEPLDKRNKLYVKKAAPSPGVLLPPRQEPPGVERSAPHPHLGRRVGDTESLRQEQSALREADRITVSQYAPPAVLINDELQVLQFRGSTQAFLQPPVGKATFHVLKMAREGLMLPLRAAIQQARKKQKPVQREGLRVKHDGKSRTVSLEVVPLVNLPERSYLILFKQADEDARAAAQEPISRTRSGSKQERASRVAELENELSETRDYLQSMQEQAEASHEELQAGNEEVQSANEELQSINEELETSKEELESANEELSTLNEELSTRNGELTRVNNDLLNLQNSAKLPLLLLGRDLALRRFSPQAEKQFELHAADLGRPIGHLRPSLFVLDAQRDPQPLSIEDVAAEVISSVREQELEVRDRAGHWHVCRVRPYLTLEGGVDGAVVVLIDIHAVRHALENTLNIVRANREPLLVLDRDLRVRIASDAFYEHYRVTRPETEGRLLYELGNGQWDIQSLRHLLEDVLPKNTRIEDYEVEHEFDLLGRRIISLHARRFEHPGETLPTILLTLQDVTERRRAEREVRRSHDELMAHADELTRFNTAAVGRELRMIELKREVNDLCRRLGEHPRYDPRLTEGA